MRIETKCLHEGYTPKNGEPQAMPIYQSTTYNYESTEHIGKLFDLAADGHMYSRISNPTVAMVEEKIAALEGGVGALCTTSGQAASLISILNICSAGDHFLAASTIYGGTINLFAVTLKRLGIECTFIDPDASSEEVAALIRPNTRLIFGETIANPALTVCDIERFAKIAHEHNMPLIVDNTFATPVLCRPIEFGADIVIHSTTKYMDGHAIQVGGVIVDSGNFNWDNGRYPELVEPDESYHGVRYVESFGKAAFITKARTQLMRDFGAYPAAINAFLLNLGLETLAVRMERYCKNAQIVAEFLAANDKVEFVNYPGLATDPYHKLAEKYGYTPYYFSKKFKQEVGMSLRDFAAEKKVERAKILLTRSKMSISDVSEALGFNSQSYFGSVFRKLCGMTPSEYQLNHGGNKEANNE